MGIVDIIILDAVLNNYNVSSDFLSASACWVPRPGGAHICSDVDENEVRLLAPRGVGFCFDLIDSGDL